MTATPSMMRFGQRLRKKKLAEVRRNAAKKAWRTRRRLAKPTAVMREVLEYLARNAETRFSIRYLGDMVCGASLRGQAQYRRFSGANVGTFRALEKRGWIEFDSRSYTGGVLGTLPNGKRGILKPSFALNYRISDKGRKALEVA